ncbi:MAG: hypothetical protein K9J13_13610 [Saprospiraceae bacterium]|nr:hypothetical protein [Saprospiraceae bacterium]
MKKAIFLSLALMLTTSLSLFATKYRVNNNTGADADFTTITSAVSGASSGDTLYVEGSSVSYGTFTLTKKLYLFGPGYFLTLNPETQANPASAIFETINLNGGSSGSLLTGLYINSRLYIDDDNIIIKRNFIGNNGILVNDNNFNIMILQNYISCNSYYESSIEVETNCSNVFIQNNFIHRGTAGYQNALIIAGTSTAIISNNYIRGNIEIRNSNFTNNILSWGGIISSNSSYHKNIGNSTQFPIDTANSVFNLQNIDMATVFEETAASSDGKKILKAGSPAIGYGVGGVDCGIFGGSDPYVLSGIPAIPAIYFFTAPSSGSSSTGLPVNVKIKSRK